MSMLSLPAATARQLRLVTFDVTGTLLNFPCSPAEQYSYVAAQMGVHAKPSELANGFNKQWRILCHQHPNFGATTGLPWHAWWSKLVKQTFLSAPSLQFDNGRGNKQSVEMQLTSVADRLIEVYSTDEGWVVAEGAKGTLVNLQREGLILGVVSNFDSRLKGLLRAVGLLDFFTFVVASYESGVAKPDARIFHEALRRASGVLEGPLGPQEACHVGDTPSSDYVGARDAGWHAVLVNEGREIKGQCSKVDPAHVVGSLKELEFYLLHERRCNKSVGV